MDHRRGEISPQVYDPWGPLFREHHLEDGSLWSLFRSPVNAESRGEKKQGRLRRTSQKINGHVPFQAAHTFIIRYKLSKIKCLTSILPTTTKTKITHVS